MCLNRMKTFNSDNLSQLKFLTLILNFTILQQIISKIKNSHLKSLIEKKAKKISINPSLIFIRVNLHSNNTLNKTIILMNLEYSLTLL